MLVVPESASEKHGQEAVNQVSVCEMTRPLIFLFQH